MRSSVQEVQLRVQKAPAVRKTHLNVELTTRTMCALQQLITTDLPQKAQVVFLCLILPKATPIAAS
jgi:hypothetical protein